MTDQTLTTEEALKIIEATLGAAEHPPFSTNMPSGGDIAVVLKANGGVEILSVMPDSPDKVNMASLGMRGLFAVALYKLAQNPELMRDALLDASKTMNVADVTRKLHS
jgi:hypothetical protein